MGDLADELGDGCQRLGTVLIAQGMGFIGDQEPPFPGEGGLELDDLGLVLV